jgi:hypothetical protein
MNERRHYYIWFRIHRRYNRYEVKAVTVGILDGFPEAALKKPDDTSRKLISERWDVLAYRRSNCWAGSPNYDHAEAKNLGYLPA